MVAGNTCRPGLTAARWLRPRRGSKGSCGPDLPREPLELPTMTVFDEATAVSRRADGVYEAHPDRRFAIVAPGGTAPPAVNGGVMIATVLRAVLDCSPLPHPVATSAHFLRVARLSPAEIHVTWLKTGRTAATARATLVQDAEAVLETTVTTGTVPVSEPHSSAPGLGELTWTDAPPLLPPPEQCVDLGQ